MCSLNENKSELCTIQKSTGHISNFRCSCNSDVRHWSKCYLKYKLQVKSIPEVTDTEKSEGRVKRFLKAKLKKAAEVFGYSQNKVAIEKSDEVVLDPKSKARKFIVHLIPCVSIDDCHLVSLNLTLNNCNCKETHLYVRYV